MRGRQRLVEVHRRTPHIHKALLESDVTELSGESRRRSRSQTYIRISRTTHGLLLTTGRLPGPIDVEGGAIDANLVRLVVRHVEAAKKGGEVRRL